VNIFAQYQQNMLDYLKKKILRVTCIYFSISSNKSKWMSEKSITTFIIKNLLKWKAKIEKSHQERELKKRSERQLMK
jgi:septum formation topological specificity factor MinE